MSRKMNHKQNRFHLVHADLTECILVYFYNFDKSKKCESVCWQELSSWFAETLLHHLQYLMNLFIAWYDGDGKPREKIT